MILKLMGFRRFSFKVADPEHHFGGRNPQIFEIVKPFWASKTFPKFSILEGIETFSNCRVFFLPSGIENSLIYWIDK